MSIAVHFGIDIHGLYIDVKAAFDSVLRTELLKCLEEDPNFNEDDVRCFYFLCADNEFWVRCGEALSQKESANMGAAQGDGASPYLFSYYLDKALTQAQESLPPSLTPPPMDTLLELPELTAYADDVDRYSTSAEYLESRLALEAPLLGEKWNLRISEDKTERIHIHTERSTSSKCTDPCVCCGKQCDRDAVQCDDCDRYTHYSCTGLDQKALQTMLNDPNSKYACKRCTSPASFDTCKWRHAKALGSLLGDEEDLARRIQLAAVAFRQHTKLFMRRALVSPKVRLRIYKAFVLPVLLYNIAALGLSETMERRFDVFHRRQLRNILGIRWPDTIRNEVLYRKTESQPLSLIAKERRWTFFGHICRLPPQIPARKAMNSFFKALDHLPRKAGRPGNCLVTTLQRDLRKSPIAHLHSLESTAGFSRLAQLAADRKRWRKHIVEAICS